MLSLGVDCSWPCEDSACLASARSVIIAHSVRRGGAWPLQAPKRNSLNRPMMTIDF